MDVHDKFTRSFNMSRIKASATKPEIIVRKLCHSLGLRYRLNQKIFGTRPDLVFKKYRSVIFVHGCFWHSHECKYGLVKPKTNTKFWENKRQKTVLRDSKNYSELKENGWTPIVIWECELCEIGEVKLKLLNHFCLLTFLEFQVKQE